MAQSPKRSKRWFIWIPIWKTSWGLCHLLWNHCKLYRRLADWFTKHISHQPFANYHVHTHSLPDIHGKLYTEHRNFLCHCWNWETGCPCPLCQDWLNLRAFQAWKGTFSSKEKQLQTQSLLEGTPKTIVLCRGNQPFCLCPSHTLYVGWLPVFVWPVYIITICILLVTYCFLIQCLVRRCSLFKPCPDNCVVDTRGSKVLLSFQLLIEDIPSADRITSCGCIFEHRSKCTLRGNGEVEQYNPHGRTRMVLQVEQWVLKWGACQADSLQLNWASRKMLVLLINNTRSRCWRFPCLKPMCSHLRQDAKGIGDLKARAVLLPPATTIG